MALSEDKKILIAEYEGALADYISIKHPIEKLVALNDLEAYWKEKLGFKKQDIVNHAVLISNPDHTRSDIQTSFSLKEILEMQNNSSQWISPNLIRAGGGLWILAGQPKTGKTLLGGYELSYSVAVSGSFLGSPCIKGKVLYFQREESLSTMNRRFASKGLESFNLAAHEAIDNNLIQIETDFNITDISYLRQKIREHKPILVIFDSLRAISASLGVSENAPEFSKYVYLLQKTLIFEQVSGLLIHHANKKSAGTGIEGMSGSLSIAGASDGIILLSSDPKDEEKLIDLRTVPRDGFPIHYQIAMDRDPLTGYSRFKKVRELGVDPIVVSFERKILRYLANFDPEVNVEKKNIATFLSIDISDSNFGFALDRLVESCQIDETKIATEDSPRGFKITYKIPVQSPWKNFDITTHPEYEEADKLMSCKTKAEIDSLKSSWETTYNTQFKNKVWACLSKPEQVKVFTIIKPVNFNIGDKVIHTADDSTYTITARRPLFNKDTWVYEVDDQNKSTFEQDLLRYELKTPIIDDEDGIEIDDL